jgi:hypothetical protein
MSRANTWCARCQRPDNSPDCVKTRTGGAPDPRMTLKKARSGVEVGTRLANSAFSRSLLLQLTRVACGKSEGILPAGLRENG